MDDQLVEWQEKNARGSSKKSTVFKALAIVILFAVLLVANDIVYYRFLENSLRSENRSSSSFDDENNTRPEPIDLDQLRAAIKAIQQQTQSNFNETSQLRGEIKDTREKVQSNLSDVYHETHRIRSDLQSVSQDLTEVEKQMSDTMIQHKLDLARVRTEMSDDRKEFGNRLDETADQIRGEISGVQKGVRADLKVIEEKQTEVSNEIKKQENDLNRLKIDLSGDGRPGKYFFYRLSGIGKFFELKKNVDSPVFTVKGIPLYITFQIETKDKSNCLGIYLCKHATATTVKARYELSLINLNGKKDLSLYFSDHIFGAADDTSWGFIKKDTILLKAYVEVLEP